MLGGVLTGNLGDYKVVNQQQSFGLGWQYAFK
jgi:hypothetical protein